MKKSLVALTVAGLTGLLAHPSIALQEYKTTFKVKHSTEIEVEHYQKEATHSSIGNIVKNSRVTENLYKQREANRYSKEMGTHYISNRMGNRYGSLANGKIQTYNRVSKNYAYDEKMRYKDSTNYSNRLTGDRFSHNYIDSYKKRERDNFHKENSNLRTGYRANITPKRFYRRANRPQRIAYMRY